MVLPQHKTVNAPRNAAEWRAHVATLDEAARLALFGVASGATRFLCATNGRWYADDDAQTIGGTRWARCYWCDTAGAVRGDPGFDRDHGQPHPYPIVEET